MRQSVRCDMIIVAPGNKREYQCPGIATIFLRTKPRWEGSSFEGIVCRARCLGHGPSRIAMAEGYDEITWQEYVTAKVMES